MTVTDEILADLHKDGLPFVQIDRSIKGEDVPCVRTDHGAGSALAVDHLVKRGRQEIAYIGGPLHIQTFDLRLEGFKKALAKHGLKPAAVKLVGNTEDEAAAAVREMLSSKSRPAALYTASIRLTIGALRAIREAGVQVPSEMEIVGFDDIAMADLFSMPVSTVCQDVEAIGREAFRSLLKVMNGQKGQRELLIPPRLKVR